MAGNSNEKRFKLLGKLPTLSGHAKRMKAVHLPASARKVEFRIPPEEASEEDVRLFRQELAELLLVDHASFPTVIECGTSKERPFYVIPQRDYRPLTKLAKDKKFSIEERAQVVRQLASAFACAHQRGIRLGAVSPVALHWDRFQARLHFIHHRYSGKVKRLPAPKVSIEGIGPEDPATRQADVFHWAYFSYWLLSMGKLPYDEEKPELTSILEHVPQLDPDFVNVLHAALSPQAALRPAHAVDLHVVLLTHPRNRVDPEEETKKSESEKTMSPEYFRESSEAFKRDNVLPEVESSQVIELGTLKSVPISPAQEGESPWRLAATVSVLTFVMGVGVGGVLFRKPARKLVVMDRKPKSTRARTREDFLRDPYIRALIQRDEVTRKDFRRVFTVLAMLAGERRLPGSLWEKARLEELTKAYKSDKDKGVGEMNLFLEELRTELRVD